MNIIDKLRFRIFVSEQITEYQNYIDEQIKNGMCNFHAMQNAKNQFIDNLYAYCQNPNALGETVDAISQIGSQQDSERPEVSSSIGARPLSNINSTSDSGILRTDRPKT